MTEEKQPDRTESARLHDDRDLIENQDDLVGGGGAHMAGNRVSKDVGSKDDVRQATDPEGPRTSATKSNEVQPATNTRSDHEGAQR